MTHFVSSGRKDGKTQPIDAAVSPKRSELEDQTDTVDNGREELVGWLVSAVTRAPADPSRRACVGQCVALSYI